MTRDQLAELLGRMSQAVDLRVTIIRVIIDERGEAGETIYRGTFVMTNADRRSSEAG